MFKPKRVTVIAGHYGSGKTNVAVNLALYLAAHGEKVTIVDLDIVNPYFRTADFKDLLESKGIHVVTPTYANTNLDIPVLPAEVDAVIAAQTGKVIIDVGGDDAGAIALGRYARAILSQSYDMFYVVNQFRYLTKTPNEAALLLPEIEATSRLKATGIINNSNLGTLTTKEHLADSKKFADEIAKQTGLPIVLTCAKKELAETNDFPVDIFVKSTWQ